MATAGLPQRMLRIGTTVNRQEAAVMLLILMSASDRSGLMSLVIQHHYTDLSRPSENLISASEISVRGTASSPVLAALLII